MRPVLRAFSTLGCPDLELDAVLALARAHGLAAVELRGLGGTLDLPGYLEARFADPAAFGRHVAQSGVRVVAFGTSVRLFAHSPADRAALLEFGAWAEAGRVPVLRIFDGGTAAEPHEIDHASALFAWWSEVRRERGWTAELVTETHDALANPEALERFVAAIPEAALLWDAHHTWRRGGEDPLRTFERIVPQVLHMHVKDSVTDKAHRLGYRYVLPGTGEFPMAGLLARLYEYQYAGVLSLEWERLWHPELPPLDEALRQAVGWW